MELPLTAEFRRFADTPDDIVAGAMLIARVVDPAAQIDWARAELDRLSAGMASVDCAEDLTAGLREAGFAGVAGAGDQSEASALDKVLAKRSGLPITLGVVVVAVADRLGLTAHGVNFPGHFLTRVDGVLVDPFAMECTSEERCRQWLQQNKLAADQAFRTASPADIVLRMLNNLRMLAVAARDLVRALEMTDYQLLLLPRAFGLHLDRAELWSALGAAEMVRQELEQAYELATDAATRAKIEEQIRAIGTAGRTLH